MTMKAIHLLRRVALRSHGRPSLPASSCRAFSVVPEAPQSAMDGSDKSLNRITRTESMVSLLIDYCGHCYLPSRLDSVYISALSLYVHRDDLSPLCVDRTITSCSSNIFFI